jgi:cytochrome P450 family 135
VRIPGPSANVFAQTVAFHRDPLGFLRAAQARFGDVFAIRLLTARPLFIVAEPTAAKELLDADPERAHAGEGRRQILPFASPRSVFGADGKQHQVASARIAPALSAETLTTRREEMAEIATRHASAWPRGRPFKLLERVRDLADEIFVCLVLGVPDERTAAAVASSVRRMLQTPGNPPLTLPGRGDGAIGALGQIAFERRRAPLTAALSWAVEERRGAGQEQIDVLGCLVATTPPLSTAEIVAELTSLLMAAQEPPSIALTWLLDRFGRDPELAERFRDEASGRSADAIVRETLRLQPPASGILRRLREPLQVAGIRLPAGATVLVPTVLAHRDPRAFERPDEFRPERWLAAQAPDGRFFPFGGGARRCIGEHLARAEIEAVLPAILAQAPIVPLSPQPEQLVQRATVLVPQRGLRAQIA